MDLNCVHAVSYVKPFDICNRISPLCNKCRREILYSTLVCLRHYTVL